MRIIKYNISKEDSIGTRTKSVSYSSSGSSYNSSTSEGSDINCRLWGNDFTGNDIDSTMLVYGDIYLYDPLGRDEDEDDDEDVNDGENSQLEDDEDDEDVGTGTLYSYGVESTDIYAKKKLWINYPTLDDDKQNVADLIKDNADKIATNTTNIASNKSEIDSLKSRVSTAETNITNLQTSINNIDGRVTTNEGDITNIKNTLENLVNEIPQVDINAPVILFSGVIHSNNNDGSLTYLPFAVRPLLYSQHTGVEKIELDYLEIDGNKKPTLVVKVNGKEGWYIKPTSIHSTVSLNSHCNPTVDFGGNRRSLGYWTTGGVFADGKIYLLAWRTDDDNNDSTTNDVIAYSVQEMNLTIFGIAYKTA